MCLLITHLKDMVIQKQKVRNNHIILVINKILNNLDSTYAQLKEDQIIYGDLDKAYITFVNDDTTPEIDKFADIFIERNIFEVCFSVNLM